MCLREPGIVVWETSTLSSRFEPLSFGVPQRLPWELQAPWPKGGCREDTAHPQQLWNRLINNYFVQIPLLQVDQKAKSVTSLPPNLPGRESPSGSQAEPPLPINHRAKHPTPNPGSQVSARRPASTGRRHSVQGQTMENLELGP